MRGFIFTILAALALLASMWAEHSGRISMDAYVVEATLILIWHAIVMRG